MTQSVATTVDERRDEILQALTRCVAKYGIHGTSIKKVAEEAGVSPALVFYYFTNKNELVTEAWSAALQHFGQRLSERGDSTGLARLEALYRVCFLDRDAQTPPWVFWLDYWSEAARNEDLSEYHENRFEGLREVIAQSVDAGIAADEVDAAIDPLLAADALLALIYGLAVEVTLDSKTVTSERAFEIARFVLSLLKRQPSPSA